MRLQGDNHPLEPTMDSASLQIKFMPVIQFFDDEPQCLIEIIPEVSEISGLNEIEWTHNAGRIEYNIPMKYKVVLKKMDDSQSAQQDFASQYYSCVDNKVLPKETFVNLTKALETNGIKRNDINKSLPNTNMTHSKHSLKFIKQSIYYSKVTEKSSKVLSQNSDMMGTIGSVTSFEDYGMANEDGNNDILPTTENAENTEITIYVGPKKTDHKLETMAMKNDYELKVFDSSFVNLSKDFDEQSTICPPIPIFDHRINYTYERVQSKTNMDYCTPKTYLHLPIHDKHTHNMSNMRWNGNLRYTDWEQLKIYLNSNNTPICSPVDSRLIRTETYKKRELPRDRITRLIKYCKNQFLPIKELLNDINKKCSELKLSPTWSKKCTNTESPVYFNRINGDNKSSFKNCKSDIKEFSRKEVIQFNRVMYTIKVDS